MVDRSGPDGACPAAGVLLEARACSKTYEETDKHKAAHPPHLVLDCIEVEIRAGEFVVLLGPSGSGKSTLLRILAGLIPPSCGQVFFEGRLQSGPNPHAAIVFQTFALFPWLTVLQNVVLGLRAQPLSDAERQEQALAAIDLIGLDGFENAYPKELSGGMRQRVGFARALVVQPELLFLDEPFSELDVLTAANLRKQLLDLWRAQRMPTKAILMVTHNIDEAVTMGDRLLVLGTNPARIRVELAGLPPDQRGPHSAARTDLVDLILRIMTSPQEDVAALLKARLPGAKTGILPPPLQPYQTLPHVDIGKVTGLVEAVHARGGREDFRQLGSAFHLKLAALLPVVEAADLLGLAYTEKGDLILTEEGRQLAEAGVLEQKQLFCEQVLANVSLVGFIVQALQTAPNHVVPEEQILSFLDTYFGEEEARAQLRTAIGWGRYAELFSFQEDRGLFRLEEASEPTQPA